jgi:hypothetical protein
MNQDELEKDLTDTQKLLWNVTSMNTALDDMKNRLDKHHKILLEGNGEIPLVEVLRNHEQFIKDVKFWLRNMALILVVNTLAGVIYEL